MLREFSWLSAGNQAATAASLLAMLVLVRETSVTTVGHVVFAQAVAGLIMLVVDVRFEDAIQRFYPLAARVSSESARSLFWKVMKWDVGFGLVIVTVTAGVWAGGLIHKSSLVEPGYVAVALMSVGFGACIGTLNAAFALTGELVQLGRLTIVVSLANLVFICIGTILAGGLGYLVGAGLGTLLQVIFLFKRSTRLIEPVGILKTTHPFPDRMGRFLVSSSLSSSLAIGTESGVIAVAGIGGGPGLAALLRVALGPARLIAALVSPISVQMFPRIAEMAARGDGPGIKSLVMKAARYILLVGGIAVVPAAAVMSPTIGILYGASYERVSLAANILMVAALGRAAFAWAKVLPVAIGRPNLRLAVVGVESMVMLTGTALLARQHDGSAYTPIAWLTLGTVALLGGFWYAVLRVRGLLPRSVSSGGMALDTVSKASAGILRQGRYERPPESSRIRSKPLLADKLNALRPCVGLAYGASQSGLQDRLAGREGRRAATRDSPEHNGSMHGAPIFRDFKVAGSRSRTEAVATWRVPEGVRKDLVMERTRGRDSHEAHRSGLLLAKRHDYRVR